VIRTFRSARNNNPSTRTAGRLSCVLAALAIAGGGCANNHGAGEEQPSLPEERELSTALLNTPFDQQIAAGAVADRTIYPHHFAANGVTLNVLGEQRVDALLEVATDQPVRVNVPDTGEPDGVHAARVAAVRERMLSAGLDESQLQVVNAPPGGPGIWSENIVLTMQQAQQGAGGAAEGGQSGQAGGSQTNPLGGPPQAQRGGGRR
jgi:hypothetical protein